MSTRGLEHYLAVLQQKAPRLVSSLQGPAQESDLAVIRKRVADFPPALAALYLRHDGQTTQHPQPLFFESYFIPLRGVDGMESELKKRRRGLLPFGKDYGGSFHAVVLDAKGGAVGSVVFSDVDAGRRTVAPNVDTFFEQLALAVETGARVLDDRLECSETFIVGGLGTLAVGDLVRHPTLARAGVRLQRVDPLVGGPIGSTGSTPAQQEALDRLTAERELDLRRDFAAPPATFAFAVDKADGVSLGLRPFSTSPVAEGTGSGSYSRQLVDGALVQIRYVRGSDGMEVQVSWRE